VDPARALVGVDVAGALSGTLLAGARMTVPDRPDQVFAEIQRLYQQTRALPTGARYDEAHSRRRASPAYVALETQIRTLADRYAVLLAVS
jgi:hypothetical protein